jgi:hypothetical protein
MGEAFWIGTCFGMDAAFCDMGEAFWTGTCFGIGAEADKDDAPAGSFEPLLLLLSCLVHSDFDAGTI